MTAKKLLLLLVPVVVSLFGIQTAFAAERLCDASFEDCRQPLLDLINNEKVEIDAAFWFMDNQSLANALINAQKRGVLVRLLVDPRSDGAHSGNTPVLASLVTAGVPMRQRIANGILHWKLMVFSGQGKVEFSGANFSSSEMIYSTPYVSYVDEAIFFTDDSAIVNSFRTKFDFWWVDTTSYSNYANIKPPQPTTSYASYPIESESCSSIPNGCGMDFLPSPFWQDNYLAKIEAGMKAEKVQLDIDMFRETNAGVVDSVIAAYNRGVPVRMVIDSSEYNNKARVWNRYNADRLFMAGVPLKITNHKGQNHEKSVLLYGQKVAAWGSSNWSLPSSNMQQEHNYFSTTAVKPWFFQWFANHFERRWNSPQEYKAFVPSAPSSPVNKSPATGATGVSQNVTLTWDGGPWGQLYDIYLSAGTTSVPKLIASNVSTGAPDPAPDHVFGTFSLSNLAPNTTYKWRIVSKTMALLTANGPTWTFTTGGTPPPAGATVTGVCVTNGACSPANGPSAGGTPVTITGTQFAPGAIVSFDQATASSVVVVDSQTITAVTPPHVGGSAMITVTNQAGDSGSLAAAFLYNSTAISNQPQLNVVVPDTSYQGGGDVATISGRNLSAGANVCFMVGGNCTPATVLPSNSVCRPSNVCLLVSVPAAASGTTASLVVTTSGGSSNPLTFKYADPPSAPNISSISASTGSTNGGTQLVLGGSGFRYGAVVSLGGPPPPIGTGIKANTIIVTNSATLCGSLPLPCILATTPSHSAGNVDVVVTNLNPATGVLDPNGSYTLPGGFTFVTAPSISNVSPSRGTFSGGDQITITGANFVSGAQVFIGNPPQAASVVSTTANSITAVTPANTTGTTAPVTVVNPDGTSSNALIYIYQ